jgi:hypothetical protein
MAGVEEIGVHVQRDVKDKKEDRPTGPYQEALVNPS